METELYDQIFDSGRAVLCFDDCECEDPSHSTIHIPLDYLLAKINGCDKVYVNFKGRNSHELSDNEARFRESIDEVVGEDSRLGCHIIGRYWVEGKELDCIGIYHISGGKLKTAYDGNICAISAVNPEYLIDSQVSSGRYQLPTSVLEDICEPSE